jgi:outer membrane lipoprotein-sorting protein
VSSRRADPGSLVGVSVLLSLLAFGACASVGPRSEPGLTPEAESARALLERRWQTFSDLRTLADLDIRRGNQVRRLTGPLLLRAPGSLRFEALTPLGLPALVVTSDPETVTIWEVLEGRAYLLSPTPDATGRWLGVPVGAEDLVALLSGHVRPLSQASSGVLHPADGLGSTLSLAGPDGTQRIWFDPATGQARQVEWTGRRQGAKVVFSGEAADLPQQVSLATLDGSLEVTLRYRGPRLDTGLDPALMRLNLPEDVRIQDLRR